MGARSRSSSATLWWPSSASPGCTRTTRLRAVRAAIEMQEALAALNEEFQRSFGTTLSTRTGVNTGEVLAGDPSHGQSFVLGDAVNVAARLEQAAEPGEILIGQATHRLVREAVAVEQVGPLELKGVAAPVTAWRRAPSRSRRDGLGAQARLGAGRPRAGARAAREPRSTARPNDRGVRARHADGRRRSGQVAARATSCSRGWAIEQRSSRAAAFPTARASRSGPSPTVLRDAAGIIDRDPPDVARRKLSGLLAGADDASVDRRPSLRTSRSRPRDARDPGDVLGVPKAARAPGHTAPARRGLRRHPVGRADIPRPPRVPRRLDPGSRPRPLSRPARPPRDAPRLDETQDQYGADHAGAPVGDRDRRPDPQPRRRRRARARGARPHRRGRRGQSPVRRGDCCASSSTTAC